MGYKVAVVGATGNVGREMLNILDERKFPADEVVVLASRRSVGVEVSYGDRTLKVKALEHYDFSDVDICLMSAGGSDRKSTRLNSSHGYISYAVFCLKKKNTLIHSTYAMLLDFLCNRVTPHLIVIL